MPIQYKNSSIPTSFATCSVWAPKEGDLHEKMQIIRLAGFDAIELAMPDLIHYGRLLNGVGPGEYEYEAIADVARNVRALAESLGLKILMLQPFSRFEGWKRGGAERLREDAFARAEGWMKVMEAAGTDMLQIGSSDAEDISSSFEELAGDIAELADIMSPKGYRIAYGNWCWGTRAATWKSAWEIVNRANRPNVGLCLNTFQSAGGEYGDPTTISGFVETCTHEELDQQWHSSLQEMSATIPGEKIFVLQVSDAYRMDPPMRNELVDGQPPHSRWSHAFRPLPGDGGYLPVKDFVDAVLATGFRGWMSIEVFDSLKGHKFKDSDGSAYTKEALQSLRDLLK